MGQKDYQQLTKTSPDIPKPDKNSFHPQNHSTAEMKDIQQITERPRMAQITLMLGVAFYWLICLLIVFISTTLPVLYSRITFANARNKGKTQAHTDWKNNKAVWYVHRSEPDFYSAAFASGALSSEWGLPMAYMHGGPVREQYYLSYRAAIMEKLLRNGNKNGIYTETN